MNFQCDRWFFALCDHYMDFFNADKLAMYFGIVPIVSNLQEGFELEKSRSVAPST
mgnify:CR=1 FL=1